MSIDVTVSPSERLQRLRRRLVTVPLILLFSFVYMILFPGVIAVCSVFDLIVRNRWSLSRCACMLAVYLMCETLGLCFSFLLWLGWVTGIGASNATYIKKNRALQSVWANCLFQAARTIFQFKIDVDIPSYIEPVATIVFIRHASIADTLLPAHFLTKAHGLELRYVLKRELLWDPCLDVVGNRLPNLFLDRRSSDGHEQGAALEDLANGIAEGEGLLIYPEGTRATSAKREKILEAIQASGDSERFQRVQKLRHVLPPRVRGPITLLATRPDAQALFFAHSGMDRVTTLKEVARGSLIDCSLKIAYWTVTANSIPRDKLAQLRWLDEQWLRIDDWIEKQLSTG